MDIQLGYFGRISENSAVTDDRFDVIARSSHSAYDALADAMMEVGLVDTPDHHRALSDLLEQHHGTDDCDAVKDECMNTPFHVWEFVVGVKLER